MRFVLRKVGGETSWGCRFPSPKLANPEGGSQATALRGESSWGCRFPSPKLVLAQRLPEGDTRRVALRCRNCWGVGSRPQNASSTELWIIS